MTAIIMAGAFVIAYIAGEGLVDATREEGGKAYLIIIRFTHE